MVDNGTVNEKHAAPALSADPAVISAFWQRTRTKVGWAGLEFILGQQQEAVVEPPWMQLSQDREEATELARDLAARGKGSSRTPLSEYPGGVDDLPKVGELAIICDGDGNPVSLVMTVGVDVETSGVSIVEEKFRSLYPVQKRSTRGK